MIGLTSLAGDCCGGWEILDLQCGTIFGLTSHQRRHSRHFQTAPQVVLVLSVLFGHSYLTHIAYYYLFIFVYRATNWNSGAVRHL